MRHKLCLERAGNGHFYWMVYEKKGRFSRWKYRQLFVEENKAEALDFIRRRCEPDEQKIQYFTNGAPDDLYR